MANFGTGVSSWQAGEVWRNHWQIRNHGSQCAFTALKPGLIGELVLRCNTMEVVY
jgi:hypothetical protein